MHSPIGAGSTGRPKGTMLEGAGLVNFVNWMVGTENLGPDDIFLQKTPISFDASMREIFPPFFCGARMVVATPGLQRDTTGLIKLITEHGVTCTSWVPSQLEIFAQVRISSHLLAGMHWMGVPVAVISDCHWFLLS